MTLQTSGVITLNDLKTEWGTTNPVSLSQFYAGGAYVGANAINVPASGRIDLSDFYGVSNGWLNDYSSSTNSVIRDIRLSSSGFLYLAGWYSSSFYTYAAKVNAASGAIVWQKYLPRGLGNFDKVVLDSSDNSYYIGTAGTGFTWIVKYNSSGTLQWQYSIDNVGGGVSGSGVDSGGIVVDSSGNIYVNIATKITSRITVHATAKFNSSLTLQWIRGIGYPFTNDSTAYPIDLVVDSSGNVYATGWATPNNSNNIQPFLIKYDSFGNFQWNKTVSSLTYRPLGISIDSSNNVYVTMQNNNAPLSGTLLKVDTNGNLVWQRTIASQSMRQPSCDPSGNIFVGLGDSSGAGNGRIAKYNSSGVIQSESRLYTISSGTNATIERVEVSSSNIPYLLFKTFTGSDSSLVKKSAVNSYLPATVNIAYPGSGSVYYTYSASVPSDSAGTLTWQDASLLGDGVPIISLTAQAYTDTAAGSSLIKVNSAY